MILLEIAGNWYAHRGEARTVPTDALQLAKVVLVTNATEAMMVKNHMGEMAVRPLVECPEIR